MLNSKVNVYEQSFFINKSDRNKLNGHKGKVLWLTGLSGSGKSTIANFLEQILHKKGIKTYILDGDNAPPVISIFLFFISKLANKN